MRIVLGVVAVLAILLVGRFTFMSLTAKPPSSLGLTEDRLSECPDKPNCVSSRATSSRNRVDPIAASGGPEKATVRAIEAIGAMPRAKLIKHEDGYLHAEYRSLVFRFVDDLELLYDEAVPGFQVRSASRVGHSDLRANRRRVELLRERLSR